jgi:voltage-gated potassium channel
MTKSKLYSIIFGTDTPEGRRFDVALLWIIFASVMVVVLETSLAQDSDFRLAFRILEWGFTLIFTVEYALRIYSHPKPRSYAFSFWGIIDLLALLPTYLSFSIAGSQAMIVIRVLRFLRVFRILKMTRYFSEAQVLTTALRNSFYKISVFFLSVLLAVTLMGSIMYVIEGGSNGFSRIPASIYWAVITITTVGYGDIVPATALGKFVASLIMIIGYAIIAVPTGIITVELNRAAKERHAEERCPHCGKALHE